MVVWYGMAKAGYNSKCDVVRRVCVDEAERLPYDIRKHDCWNVRAEYFALRCSSNDFHNPLRPQEVGLRQAELGPCDVKVHLHT